ncbi:Chromatin assembly factor 1, subunit A [Podila clonocystis]|nr:Chromatin assembly factor 1, subunit A [Podila clonocystis]
MPPKSSAPTLTRTLSGFFSKNGASSSTSSGQSDPQDTTINDNVPQEHNEGNVVANPPTPEKPKGRNATKIKPATPKKKSTPNETDSATTTIEATHTPVPESPKKSRKKKKTDPGETVETLVAVEIPPHEKSTRKKKKAPKPETEGAPLVDSMTTEAPPTPAPTVPTVPTALSIPPSTQEPPKSPSKQPHTGSGSATKANPFPLPGAQLNKFNKTDSASMFRIKNGKASITETKLKFMSHPSSIADLCKFHEYRQALQDEDHGMTEDARQLEDHVEITRIPSNHYGLIAKLVEESELLLAELATIIMATLCPREFEAFEDFGPTEEGDVAMDVDVESEGNPGQRRGATTVSTTAIMEAIQSVAQRVNYGVPVSNLPVSVPATPANLSVFRWEVQDVDQYFPPDMKAAVIKRRGKRMEASAALTAWFLGLDRKQQEDLCPVPVATVRPVTEGAPVPTKRNRTSMGGDLMDIDMELSHTKMVKETDNGPPTVLEAASILEDQATVEASVDPAVLESKLKEIEAKKKEAEAKKKEAEAKEERRLEKERKLAERQHEKDMKEAERLQKEETKKQTSQRFVGFFKPVAPPVAKKEVSQLQAKNDPAQSCLLELFHPFHVKKSTTLAPINRFSKELSIKEFDQQIALASENDMDVDHIPKLDPQSAKAELSALFGKKTRSADRSNASNNKTKKLPPHYLTMTVKELMHSGALLQDGDDNMDEMLTWRDIPALRMRLLQFAENYRPAYFGTWSKRSKHINGRRFLGKDTHLIEYDVDSEAEWEEDEEGEECKSDDDEDDADEVGSEQEEEDDWLVPEGYLSEDEGLDAGEEGHKGESMKRSKEMKRTLVSHIAPIIVGPVFEMVLGEQSSHPALEPYHIKFIGDFGVGMDMFHAVETSMLAAAPTQV